MGTKKHPGKKANKPWPLLFEIQCPCNHSEGLRTGGNKGHQSLQRSKLTMRQRRIRTGDQALEGHTGGIAPAECENEDD